MKTLKKVLAVLLALAMVLGMTVVASATFTDAAEIGADYKEAVEVMNAVGVFVGSNGKMSPKANLTRAEAAKLVTYLLLGEDTAEALPVTAIFNDVPLTHWANKYIAYLANEGIVAGVGAGKFNPNGNVTGYEFGKMVLGALGYNATYEGLTGTNWAINDAKLMKAAGIVNAAAAKKANLALTREEAALYCLNALKAPVVEYEDQYTITVGNVQVASSKKANTILNSSTLNVADCMENVLLQLGEKLYEGDLVLDEDADDFKNPANVWSYELETVGTYATVADFSYTGKVTLAKIYADLGETIAKKLTNKEAATNNKAWNYDVYVDGVEVTNAVSSGNTDAAVADKTATTASVQSGNGTTTNVYVNNTTNVVTFVTVNTYEVSAVADYNKTTGTVKLDTYTVKGSDFPAVVDCKAKDEFIITKVGSTVESVEKATTVAGTITKLVGTSDTVATSVYVDGTEYKFNVLQTALGNNLAVGAKVKYVLDTQGYVIDKLTYSYDLSEYVFIRDTEKKTHFASEYYMAEAVFADGTIKTITIDADGSTPVKGNWYVFNVEADGDYYLSSGTLTQLNRETAPGAATLMENGNTVISVSPSIKANNGSKFVVSEMVSDKEAISECTGVKYMPTVKHTLPGQHAYIYALVDANGYVELAYVDARKAGVEVSDANYKGSVYFVVDLGNVTKDSKTGVYWYEEAKVLVDNVETTLKIKLAAGAVEGKLYSEVNFDADGNIIGMTQLSSKPENKTYNDFNDVDANDEVLIVDTDDMVLADNAKITVVVTKKGYMADKSLDYELYDFTTAEDLAAFITATREATGDSVAMYTILDATTSEVTNIIVVLNEATLS